MVWVLFPVDPLSGEDRYYIFRSGVYKVGRKGCDVIITKDKGVSRVHAQILVNAMPSLNPLANEPFSPNVQIRDCSKYGTFISKNVGPRKKVHELPNKETTLEDGDLVSFGTGSATYRFCHVPLVFYLCSFDKVDQTLEEKISSIGACITHTLSQECTHVMVDQLMPLKEDLVAAVVAKKPCVLKTWLEFVAEKNIGTEIPSCNSHMPTLLVEGASVKVADPKTRESCLKGYTFLLESVHMYKFGDQLKSLLEVGGAKTVSFEEFCLNSQGSDYGDDNRVVCVIPGLAACKSDRFNKLGSLSRVNEVDAIFAALSGQLDLSVLISPCAKIIDRKLDSDGRQYLSWKKAIDIFLGGIGKQDHLTNMPPTGAAKMRWSMEDKRLFSLIFNTLDSEVQDNTNHCETVKELWKFLEEVYSGKDNLMQLYDLYQELFHLDGKGKSLSQMFTEFNRIFEQWKSLMPISSDVTAMQAQREQLGALCFLLMLPPEWSTARQQILSRDESLTVKGVYSCLLRVYRDRYVSPSVSESSALVGSISRGGRGGRGRGRDSGGCSDSGGGQGESGGRGGSLNHIECHYCHELGHYKRNCPKLQGGRYLQSSQFPYIASTDTEFRPGTTRMIAMTEDEFARYSQFQASQPSTPAATLVKTSNSVACLSDSRSKWVIDSEATDHMIGISGSFVEEDI